MNPFLTVPRDIIFLLVQHLDIRDITRLCQTSREVAKVVISRVNEIHYPKKCIWRLQKEKEIHQGRVEDIVNSGLLTSQRKLFYDSLPTPRVAIHPESERGYELSGETYSIPRYTRPKVDPVYEYSLTLPPIYLLNQYPSLTKCDVPFLGSVSDLLDVNPASLGKLVHRQLKIICTYPMPSGSMYSYFRLWIPLPSKGKRSLRQRMREWLVSFVLLYPDATLSLIIIPEDNLIQTNNRFEIRYNSFHYANHRVQTSLPFTKGEYIEEGSDRFGLAYSLSLESNSGNTVIPVELWLNMLETMPTDDVEVGLDRYDNNYHRDVTGICSFLRTHFPLRIPPRDMWGPTVWQSMHAMDFDSYETPESACVGIVKQLTLFERKDIHDNFSNLLWKWSEKFHQLTHNRLLSQTATRGIRLPPRTLMPAHGIPRNLNLLGVPANVVKREKKVQRKTNFEQKRTQKKREKRTPLVQKNFHQKKYR